MVKINKIECIGCGACVDVCEVNVLGLRGKKSFVEHPDDCIICRACEVQCPTHAIKVFSVVAK